jgi:hypothetical protein
VIGLSLALLNIGNAAEGIKSVRDLELLSRALGGTMRGMKTAFGCTLAGLMTAVLMSFLNHSLRRRQSVVSAEIEEFLLCELMPAVEHVDPDADSASKAFAGVLARAAAQMETVSNNLNMAAGAYRQSADEVKGTLQSLVDSVEKFAATLERVAGNQVEFSRTMTETREAIKGVGATVDASTALLQKQLESLGSEVKTNQAVQKSILEYHEEYKKFVRDSTETLRGTMTSAARQQADETRRAVEAILSKHLEGLEGMVTAHRGVMQTVSDMVLDVQLNGRAKALASHGGQAS